MANELNVKLQRADLEQLLGEKIVSYGTKYLTAPGDNYGSIMLAVSATSHSGKMWNLVAKTFPEPESVRELFHSPLSMRKEINMYMQVSPEFEKIQEEHSVPLAERLHIFCSCPGARLTLQGYDVNELADENSVLLLENLRSQGYRTGDRVTGVDLKHAEMVITRLAKFHATVVAIKLSKPEVFKSKIIKACKAFKIKFSTKENDEIRAKTFIESLRVIPICEQNIDLLGNHINKYVNYAHSDEFETPTEPFATMVHDDLWTNNMMFKYKSEINKVPVDLKIFDFQVVRYGSPVSDIIFFLFTSTEIGIVSQHLHRLLKLYHQTFLHWLEILGCEKNMFLFSDFMNEVNSIAPSEITHILYWLLPLTIRKGQESSTDNPPDGKFEFNEDYIKKAREVVTVFLENNWL